MAKRVSTQRVRKHRQYTYDEAADLLSVSPQTVRSWRPLGLPVMDGQRPHYILGEALIEFVGKRQLRGRSKMAQDEFWCFHCRAAHRPYGMLADYMPMTPTRGRLVALCAVCEGMCQRFVSAADLEKLGQILAIATNSEVQA